VVMWSGDLWCASECKSFFSLRLLCFALNFLWFLLLRVAGVGLCVDMWTAFEIFRDVTKILLGIFLLCIFLDWFLIFIDIFKFFIIFFKLLIKNITKF
jgi:hypothetical protein